MPTKFPVHLDNAFSMTSGLTSQNVQEVVEQEAMLKHGSLYFRGNNYSDWYAMAYDAYESWYKGDDWGRLFEKIAEKLEEMEHDRDERLLGSDTIEDEDYYDGE